MMDSNNARAPKTKAQRSRPMYEAILPFLLFVFIGYCLADLIILKYRGLMIPTQAPPSRPKSFAPITSLTSGAGQIIVSRNMFSADGLIPDPLAQEAAGETAAEQDPVPSSLPLTLTGTIVHSNPEKSIANIKVQSKNKVIPYSAGRDIEGLANLIRVERKRVVFRNTNNGRLEFIEMKDAGKINFNASKTAAAGSTDVVQTAPNRFEISRSDLTKYTKDLGSILQQAAMAPRRGANGEIECFRFLAIQPGSIFSRLGLQVGDCLKSVNGMAIKSPADAMKAYQDMGNQSNISLGMERDGRDTENNYTVKP